MRFRMLLVFLRSMPLIKNKSINTQSPVGMNQVNTPVSVVVSNKINPLIGRPK